MTRLLRVLLLVLAVSGCQKNEQATTAPPKFTQADSEAIVAVLDQQVAAWNAGDVDAYMAAYSQEGGLRVASDRGISRGWKEIRSLYATNYSTPEVMGQLSFHDLEITPLSASHAEAFGRYLLTRNEPLPGASGFYTMLLEKTPTGWRIVHDHSTEERTLDQ